MAKKPGFEINYKDELVAVVQVDKNNQVCDIRPRTELTNSLLNTYRGRPISLAFADIQSDIVEAYEKANKSTEESL